MYQHVVVEHVQPYRVCCQVLNVIIRLVLVSRKPSVKQPFQELRKPKQLYKQYTLSQAVASTYVETIASNHRGLPAGFGR
jgi:hypothetical protein